MAHECVPHNQVLIVCRKSEPVFQICGTHGRENLITSNAEEQEGHIYARNRNYSNTFFSKFSIPFYEIWYVVETYFQLISSDHCSRVRTVGTHVRRKIRWFTFEHIQSDFFQTSYDSRYYWNLEIVVWKSLTCIQGHRCARMQTVLRSFS